MDDQKSKGTLADDVEQRRGMMVVGGPDGGGGAMQPRNLGEAMEFARILAGSGMVPDCYRKQPGNVLVAVQMGAELGLPPMQSIQNIAVVNGRPSLWGDGLLAVVIAHPECESVDEMDLAEIGAGGSATCVVKRRGHAPHAETFSIADAKAAGLWGKKGPWSQYPNRMLQLRARGFACRNKFPDALRGIQSAEEARDIPTGHRSQVVDSTPSSIVERLKGRASNPEPVDADIVGGRNGELSKEQEQAAFGQGGEGGDDV